MVAASVPMTDLHRQRQDLGMDLVAPLTAPGNMAEGVQGTEDKGRGRVLQYFQLQGM